MSDDSLNSQPASYPCRILIVDDDPFYRERHAAYVKSMGYEAFVAEGEREALLQDAQAQAWAHRCHLALVDMRLKDHEDRADLSGLELAKKLYPTLSIVVSGFGDIEIAVEAVKQKHIYNFVEKDRGPARLKEVVRQAVALCCPSEPMLNWPLDYDPAMIVRRLKLNDNSVPTDEPVCVLRRLYTNEQADADEDHIAQVEFTPATEHYRASEEVAPLERSVVLVARSVTKHRRWSQEKIVKLASATQVKNEITCYHKYVKPFLFPHRTARLEDSKDSVVLWDVGAILYTNIATNDREPLRSWYAKAETTEVTRALRDLFNETLRPWYRENSEQNYYEVYRYYTEHFEKLGQRLHDYDGTDEFIEIPELPYRLLNPILWAKQYAPRSRFLSRWTAYTHGDLHSDNVFVDRYTQTSVIDYERSGPGYILRDFVELETEIRLRLLPLTSLAELKLAYELDLMLFAPEHPNEIPEWRDISGLSDKAQTKARKAFDAIVTLRQLAHQHAGLEQMKEYYWALLMETLFSVLRNYAEWDNRAKPELAEKRALLAAALLSERLAHWREKWTPDEWTAPKTTTCEFSHGYALLVGVGANKFKSEWSLPVTVKDIAQVNHVLVDENLCAYSHTHIRLLHDTTATVERIRADLQWLSNQAVRDRDATVIVYFSGHGWQTEDGQYALIPHDANPAQLPSTVLWGEEFSKLLRDIPAKRLLVIVDACHAGGMAKAPNDILALPQGFSKGTPPTALFNELRQGTGRIVLSSSGENQLSYILDDGSQSVFTYHLLEALRGAENHPGDTTVTVSHLIRHLGKTVPATARTQYHAEQTPWQILTGEDFAIAMLMGGKGLRP